MPETESTGEAAGKGTSDAQIISILALGVLMVALDIAVVAPILPAIQREFHLTIRQLPWIIGSYIIANLAARPILGKLSDILGRRMVFAGSAVIYAAGALVSFLSPSFGLLLAGRALQGFGNGGIFPVASAAVSDFLPPERRGRALHIMASAIGIAFLVGIPAGGLLSLLGWRWVFAAGVPVAFAIALAAVSTIPSTPRRQVRTLDLPGTIFLVLMASAAALGLNTIDFSSPLASFKTISVWPLFAIFLAALLILALLERKAEEPVFRPGILHGWRMKLGAHLILGVGVLEVGVVFLPVYAVTALGAPDITAWLRLLPFLAVMAIATPFTNPLGGRRGTRWAVVGGALLVGAAMLAFGRMDLTSSAFYIAGAVAGLGFALLLSPSLRHKAIGDLPPDDHPAAQRLIFIFNVLGRLVGAAAFGALAASCEDALTGFRHAYMALACFALLVSLLSLLLSSRQTAEA